jgi:hypothetical protein
MQLMQIVSLAAMIAAIVAGVLMIWRMTPDEPAVGPHERKGLLLAGAGASASSEALSPVDVIPMELPHCRQAQPESE